MSKIEIGSPVTVYDRYRFAIPLKGKVTCFADKNDGVQVVLQESNNNNYPAGSRVWVHKFQLRPITTVSDKSNKPPIGLRPRKVIDEERLVEIGQAIMRYTTTTKFIPQEWVDEYNEIVERMHGKL